MFDADGNTKEERCLGVVSLEKRMEDVLEEEYPKYDCQHYPKNKEREGAQDGIASKIEDFFYDTTACILLHCK
jgi:hypothetical protein